FFGLCPAGRAAGLDRIEALRFEWRRFGIASQVIVHAQVFFTARSAPRLRWPPGLLLLVGVRRRRDHDLRDQRVLRRRRRPAATTIPRWRAAGRRTLDRGFCERQADASHY